VLEVFDSSAGRSEKQAADIKLREQNYAEGGSYVSSGPKPSFCDASHPEATVRAAMPDDVSLWTIVDV
jgi:hypothetical protein